MYAPYSPVITLLNQKISKPREIMLLYCHSIGFLCKVLKYKKKKKRFQLGRGVLKKFRIPLSLFATVSLANSLG